LRHRHLGLAIERRSFEEPVPRIAIGKALTAMAEDTARGL
jgi:hypothetical protein